MEQTINERIAGAMLKQCALVWEYVVKGSNEGDFRLNEVRQGVSGKTVTLRMNSKTGMLFVDTDDIPGADALRRRMTAIGGITVGRNFHITLECGSFCCSYKMKDVFDVAYRFCQANLPSLVRKPLFGCHGGLRLSVLPEGVGADPVNVKAATKPLSVEDLLRAALMERLAA